MFRSTMLALLAFAGVVRSRLRGWSRLLSTLPPRWSTKTVAESASKLWPDRRSKSDSLHSVAEDADRVLAEQSRDAPAAAATLKARDNLKPPEWHTWNSSDHGLIPVYAHDISKNYRDPLAPPPADNVRLFEDQLRKLNQTFKDSEAPFRFIYTGVYTKYRPSYDYGGKPCPTVDSPVETAVRHNRHMGDCSALNWYLVDRLTTGSPCRDISSHANDPFKCHLSAENMHQDGITITRNAMNTSSDGTEFITAAAKWLGLDFENKLALRRCKDGDLLGSDSEMARRLHSDCPIPVTCAQDPTTHKLWVDPMNSYMDHIPDHCKRRFRRTEVDRMAWNFVALREGLFHRN